MTGAAFVSAPIIVLDPDVREAQQVAGWLRSAGLGRISAIATTDEAIFMLGRQRPGLLIIDERVPVNAERRLLRHIAACGHAPPLVRLVDAAHVEPSGGDRAAAAELIRKPLLAHDVVVRIGTAMERPDLLGQLDRKRDEAAEHLAAARRMQLGLLPDDIQLAALQGACGVGLTGFCRSGEAVGGDFWGAWPTGRGRFAVALADFAGHGLSAAVNTFRLHAILSEQALPRGMPARMARLLNRRLHSLLPRGHYATMVYAQIDPATRRLAWCSAGGPPPIFVSASGWVELPGRGVPLGVVAGATYGSTLTRLPSAGILCLFSDGLYESGAEAPEIPRHTIAAALGPAADAAAAGHLAHASELGARALEHLRDQHPCGDYSDDVMAVCVALGPLARDTSA